jgi:hypothetical protein
LNYRQLLWCRRPFSVSLRSPPIHVPSLNTMNWIFMKFLACGFARGENLIFVLSSHRKTTQNIISLVCPVSC